MTRGLKPALRVHVGGGYPVYISQGLLGQVGMLLRRHLPHAETCALISSKCIFRLHGDGLQASLEEAGMRCHFLAVPDGEEAKSWETAWRLLLRLPELDLDRDSVIIALGGGSIGDLAGFVAALYLRGIRLVQVPTTLLSQLDSAIGGKAAVNHPLGKNLVGVYHQPSLVAVDPLLLETLPHRDYVSGMAEAVKYGVIADGKLFSLLEEEVETLLSREMEILTEVIIRCCRVKARIVEADARDVKGVRAALNYGHTVGHALEHLSRPRLRHGEAVALGMEVEALIAYRLGLIPLGDLERQGRLLEALDLGIRPRRIRPQKLLEAMRRDKKNRGGVIRMALPRGIGRRPLLRGVEEHLILKALEEMWRG